jgi:hypothetical protein
MTSKILKKFINGPPWSLSEISIPRLGGNEKGRYGFFV